MGRLTILQNDEEMLLTDLRSKVRKKIETHPYLVRLSKNMLEVFTTTLSIWPGTESDFFFDLGPKN